MIRRSFEILFNQSQKKKNTCVWASRVEAICDVTDSDESKTPTSGCAKYDSYKIGVFVRDVIPTI